MKKYFCQHCNKEMSKQDITFNLNMFSSMFEGNLHEFKTIEEMNDFLKEEDMMQCISCHVKELDELIAEEWKPGDVNYDEGKHYRPFFDVPNCAKILDAAFDKITRGVYQDHCDYSDDDDGYGIYI